jgi:Ca2+/H+ antiporter
VHILSWLVTPALALSFRQVEMAAMIGATLFVGVVLFGGRSSRLRGGLLIAAYIGIAVAFYLAGDR